MDTPILSEHVGIEDDAMSEMLNQLVESLSIIDSNIIKLIELLPCKQLQLINMDVESIFIHLEDLKENGPQPCFLDIPLVDSEMPDESLK